MPTVLDLEGIKQLAHIVPRIYSVPCVLFQQACLLLRRGVVLMLRQVASFCGTPVCKVVISEALPVDNIQMPFSLPTLRLQMCNNMSPSSSSICNLSACEYVLKTQPLLCCRLWDLEQP